MGDKRVDRILFKRSRGTSRKERVSASAGRLWRGAVLIFGGSARTAFLDGLATKNANQSICQVIKTRSVAYLVY
jgi:hypothetical protein